MVRHGGSGVVYLYRGEIISDVKGSVCVMFRNFIPQSVEGEKREGVQISKQSTQNL